MRPLTEGLLRGNTESLIQQGWKPDEVQRCFKKADALLDYIGRIKPSEYSPSSWGKRLNDQRLEGIRYCLEKDMPSPQMRERSIQVLSTLLSIGEDLMLRAAWLYRNYPALFKAKYATSQQAYQKDAQYYFINGHIVPENSFPAFKAGINPAVSRDDNFLSKCIEMYNDPIHETSEFQDFSSLPMGKKFPYAQWLRRSRAGRKFFDESRALHHVVHQLALENKVESNSGNTITIQLLQKKKKTK